MLHLDPAMPGDALWHVVPLAAPFASLAALLLAKARGSK